MHVGVMPCQLSSELGLHAHLHIMHSCNPSAAGPICCCDTACRVQLLGLLPAHSSNQQPSRPQLYTAAVLQHAALLLLLLVSDGLLLLVPSASVPASVLQALHVLARVKQQLQQQLIILQRVERLQQKSAQKQDSRDRQQGQAVGSLGSEGHGAGVQQYERLLQLLQQKPPTQLHVVLQVVKHNALQGTCIRSSKCLAVISQCLSSHVHCNVRSACMSCPVRMMQHSSNCSACVTPVVRWCNITCGRASTCWNAGAAC